MALRDVMDHAVRVQREITAPTMLRKSRAGMIVAIVLCVPLLAISAYSWIAHPAAIWGQASAQAPIRDEANVRFTMFLLAERLQSYRESEGAYPASLAALGESESVAAYRVTSDSSFELRSNLAGRDIVYQSTEPADALLGNSLAIIKGTR